MSTFLQDLRFAIRNLRRTPAFPMADAGSPGAGTLGSGTRAPTAAAVGALRATSSEVASTPHPSDR